MASAEGDLTLKEEDNAASAQRFMTEAKWASLIKRAVAYANRRLGKGFSPARAEEVALDSIADYLDPTRTGGSENTYEELAWKVCSIINGRVRNLHSGKMEKNPQRPQRKRIGDSGVSGMKVRKVLFSLRRWRKKPLMS